MYLQDAVETQDVVKRFAEFHFRFDLIFWLIVDEIKRKFLQHSLWLLLFLLLLMLWYANGICAGQEAAHTKRRVRFRFFCIFQILYTARGIFHAILLLSAYVTLVVVVVHFDKQQQLPASICVCLRICRMQQKGGRGTGDTASSFSRAPAHVLHTRRLRYAM